MKGKNNKIHRSIQVKDHKINAFFSTNKTCRAMSVCIPVPSPQRHLLVEASYLDYINKISSKNPQVAKHFFFFFNGLSKN